LYLLFIIKSVKTNIN